MKTNNSLRNKSHNKENIFFGKGDKLLINKIAKLTGFIGRNDGKIKPYNPPLVVDSNTSLNVGRSFEREHSGRANFVRQHDEKGEVVHRLYPALETSPNGEKLFPHVIIITIFATLLLNGMRRISDADGQ